MVGDVYIRQLEPLVSPQFDHDAEPFVRAVDPVAGPTLSPADVEIKVLKPENPRSAIATPPPHDRTRRGSTMKKPNDALLTPSLRR